MLLLFSILNAQLLTDQCGRVAIVDNRPILVDLGGAQKGEGLSFLLERDDLAKQYLDSYRLGNRINKVNAVLGSLGTVSLFWGIFKVKDVKSTYVTGGAGLMILNFMASLVMNHYNEKNLDQAIYEYNQRNYPKIEFSKDALEINYQRSF